MNKAKFILSKEKLLKQVQKIRNNGLNISYSYKTNRDVGKQLINMKECKDLDFSVHTKKEIEDFDEKNISRVWFFTQAENIEEIKNLLNKGIKKFVVDNEVDLNRLIETLKQSSKTISLSLRMKFQEHRIGSGRYFVYGMPSKKIKEKINKLKNEDKIKELGVHIHRKSQNISEWEIIEELKDSLENSLESINFINLGGGLPVEYKNCSSKVLPYIFDQLKKTKEFLDKKNIKTYIEPGRFLAAPCIELKTKIIQIYEKNIILNTTLYNCALDTLIGEHKMLIKEELKEGEGNYYLIKGNSPTRDDIFRYKVKLKNPKVGDELTFINAGSYNYTTDFFGYEKLETEIQENF